MDFASDVVFEVVLRPNPPLAPKVLKAILGAVIAFNFCFAAAFVARGAWPVAPFLGLDVALLAWALRASGAAARREEQLTLTRSVLQIRRRPEQGEIALNPYWLRVEAARSSGILLWSHGKATWIGRFLGVDARDAVVADLKHALWRARNF